MIQHLVVNGCSYTAESPHCEPWPGYLLPRINPISYKNLAQGGAGNRYISWSTMEYLATANLDPAQTLVLIMWSGVDRRDMMISPAWAQHLRDYYGWIPQQNYPMEPGRDDAVHYLLSGGQTGSWMDTTALAEVFHPQYRMSDPHVMAKESLFDFVNLRDYLDRRGYQYKFTAFMNLWAATDLPFGQTDCAINMDQQAIARDWDWSPWFFADDHKNGLAEFAYALGQIQGLHPTTQAHRRFAESVVWSNIKELV